MLYKTTNKLFKNTYRYKIVVVCPNAIWFRGGLDHALKQLIAFKESPTGASLSSGAAGAVYSYIKSNIKTKEDLEYVRKLQDTLYSIEDIELRVESPLISIYTNIELNIEKIKRIDTSRVKYISLPPTDTILEEDTIIMPMRASFDYRVTIGKTSSEYSAFVMWAEGNKKIKLTKSCKNQLSKTRSWGGTSFYLSGDNNLLMAKMHLGGSIAKIERILKVKP
jgi:hypothetical protein